MSENIHRKEEQESKKKNEKPLKISHVVYGTKDFVDCMEAVIKIRKEL